MVNILVIGSESSGSNLVAKTIARAIDIKWDGYGEKLTPIGLIEHSSIPTGSNKHWMGIEDMITDRTHVIITTRDMTASALSKKQRWPFKQYPEAEVMFAYKMINKIIPKTNNYIFSYETFIAMGYVYLNLLYDWLEINSSYCPELIDGNKKYYADIS